MKIVGSTIIITILLLMSLEMKLMPYVNKASVPIMTTSTSSSDTVVVFVVNDIPWNEQIVKDLKYGTKLKTMFSGSYEHPLSLGAPPEYIFSKVRFSAYVGPNTSSYPTNISIAISRNVTIDKLKNVLQYFKIHAFKKEMYVIEIPDLFVSDSLIDQSSLIINETFNIFLYNRTTILRVTEHLEDSKEPTLRLSMWGPNVMNMVGLRKWRAEEIAVLTAGLLNVPVPGNSIGRTPEELLQVSESSLALTRTQNSLHLASVCVSTATNYCSYSPFKYISESFLTKCDFKKYMSEIKSNLRKENYELVRMMAKHLENRSLKCILQYKSLCITFTVIFATTITFLWIYILIISFIVLEEITEYYNRTVMLFTVALHVIFFVLIVVCAYTVLVLSWPYRYIVYLALIVVLIWIALIQSSYVFNFVPMHVKSYITWLLMFYFAVNEIVYWSWENEYMLFALLVPYVTAEWVYKHYDPVGKHLLIAIVLNVTLLLLCILHFMKAYVLSFETHLLELLSMSCWLLAGFPLVYRYRANPFVVTPLLLTQAILVYMLAIVGFHPEGISFYTNAVSWWLLTAPMVVFCLTDRNSISILLIGYSSSVPVLLLCKGYESVALLIMFVHMYSWYTMETVPQSDSIRKIARGVSLYLYLLLCHLFTRGEVEISRFLTKPYENWILIQILKVYKEMLPSLLLCFLWAVLHKVQKQSFGKSVNYVLMLCVSVSFRHFISVVIDDSNMENLFNNYIFHLNCLLSLFITKALFKDFKVPFGYFIPLRPNKKLFVVTKFIRHKIQKNNDIYNCLFI